MDLAWVGQQRDQRVFISEISLAGSCGDVGKQWCGAQSSPLRQGYWQNLWGWWGSLARMRACRKL